MGDHRKIHWKKWEVLCKPKEEGGVVWVLKVCVSSMRPCLLNKCEGWFMISTPCFTRCL